MDYIQAKIVCGDAAECEIVMAWLAEEGYDYFEEDGKTLNAYIEQDRFDEGVLNEICAQYQATVQVQHIEQQNWNAEWEKGFEAVRVGDFCLVRAGFHAADDSVAHEIVITPKMSFGTGHHATTRMMIEAMSLQEFSGRTVLDFGSGTGVLAILAHKLGAADVVAVDNDEWSYENAVENAAVNDAGRIEILKGSLDVVMHKTYDIILANINRHILLQYMNDMQAILKPGGIIMMSGILDEDVTLITTEAQKAGLTLKVDKRLDKWACLTFTTANVELL